MLTTVVSLLKTLISCTLFYIGKEGPANLVHIYLGSLFIICKLLLKSKNALDQFISQPYIKINITFF